MKNLYLLVLTLILAGCSVLERSEKVPSLYVLKPAPASVGIAFDGPVPEIAIRKPEIEPGLNTEKIAVLKADRTLDFISGARWAGQLEDVLASFLQASYENKLPLNSVVEEGYQSAADWDVVTTVRDFQAEYSGYEASEPPVIRVTFLMTLRDRNNGKTLNKLVLSRVVPAQANTETDIISAFEQALREVTQESIQRFFGGLN